MKRENDLGRDDVGALVWRTALPSMLAQFVSVLYSIVDRMYIGHIAGAGETALAGVGAIMWGMKYTRISPTIGAMPGIKCFIAAVLGGIGNIRGSIISATLLTILPELLRAFANYRMLIYAIVLILVMLATNNPTLRSLVQRIIPHKKGQKKEADEA